MKRKMIGVLTTLVLLSGLGFTESAYADWQQTGYGWTYTENGLNKTGWFLNNDSNWYYFDYDGIMETGWINDKDTWYFLNDSGALDETKTTTTIPNDMQAIYNVIVVYNDSGNLKYDNKKHINEIGLRDKSLYKFISKDESDNVISEYYYDSSNGNIYKSKQGTITLLNTNTIISSANSSITSDEAVKKVRDYLESNGKQVPDVIKVELDKGDKYEVHCYKDSNNSISIDDRYYVDKYTGSVTSVY